MDSSIVLLLKASILLAVALLAARAMTRGSASRRHQLWSGCFVALMLLPALGLVLPPIEIDVPAPSSVAVSSPAAATTALSEPRVSDRASAGTAASSLDPAPVERGRRIEWPTLRESIIGIWGAGVLIALGALAVSLFRVHRLSRRATDMGDDRWRASADSIASHFGIGRPVRLVTAESVVTPMAAGVINPTVFLPNDAATWPAERRDMVLAHELAHLASRDPLRHLVSRVALTAYWFHPLAWMAARESTTACEQACDEAVLSLGIRPSTYAQVLLDFASGAPAATPAAALPIVRRNLLEARLMAILEHSPRPSGRIAVPALLGTALTLCVAAVSPATEAPTGAASPIAASALNGLPADATAPGLPAVSPAGNSPLGSQAPVQRAALVPAPECGRAGFVGTMRSESNGSIDRMVQKSFEDLRVCVVAHQLDGRDALPSGWAQHATYVVMETEERSGDRLRLEINRGVSTFSVNGRAQAMSPETQQWRSSLLAVVDAVWEIGEVRGRVSTLRGQISTVRGERSTLLGEISTLRGHVSTLRGEISTLRGHQSTLSGEISSIRGHHSTLLGQVSSAQGAISSLQAARNDRYADRASIDAAIDRHEDEIRRLRAEIARYDVEARVREVERRMASFDVEARVREVEDRIRDFDVEAKVAEVERRLARLDVEGQVRLIEDEISRVDADARVAALEARQASALAALRASLR